MSTCVCLEGPADRFSLGMLDGPIKVGAPFSVNISFQDEFGHTTKPPSDCAPRLTARSVHDEHVSCQLTLPQHVLLTCHTDLHLFHQWP